MGFFGWNPIRKMQFTSGWGQVDALFSLTPLAGAIHASWKGPPLTSKLGNVSQLPYHLK
jgi:hypothetical protein